MYISFLTKPDANSLSEYGRAFIQFIKENERLPLNENTLKTVNESCKQAEKLFNGSERRTKDEKGNNEAYSTHLYEVAKLYLENGLNPSLDGLIAALRHDDIEDIKEIDFQQILDQHGLKTALMCQMLTKPEPELGETKQERNARYLARFTSIESLQKHVKVLLQSFGEELNDNEILQVARTSGTLKICDRIHNIRTMDSNTYSTEKIDAKCKESYEALMPLALSLGNPPLENKIREAILHGIKMSSKNKIHYLTSNKAL